LNCAAIPLGLLESELFGHEKGAFTGAIAQKTGRFELANKGTLFLDEVGDIPLELQAKLLRVLQEKEFERLGGNKTHKVDVRLLAATHCDLAAMVKEGTFRDDLYYRLKVFPIPIPALRQRTEDIPKLVWHFTSFYGQRMNKKIEEIPTDTMDALVRYRWPGNVRELQNFIERAVILSPRSVLRAPTSELEAFNSRREAGLPISGLAQAEREHILRALEASNWVIGGRNGAAERLGLKRTSLVYRMKKLQINRRGACPGKSAGAAASARRHVRTSSRGPGDRSKFLSSWAAFGCVTRTATDARQCWVSVTLSPAKLELHAARHPEIFVKGQDNSSPIPESGRHSPLASHLP